MRYSELLESFYHVTPTENVEKIKREGLKAQIGGRSEKVEDTPMVFLFPSRDAVHDGMNWLLDNFDEDIPLSVLTVDLPDGFPITVNGGEAYTEMDIPSSTITDVQDLDFFT